MLVDTLETQCYPNIVTSAGGAQNMKFFWAEIKPLELDPDNAGAGKQTNFQPFIH